jgi:NADPH:quinone reductase-like Zn-dependent oxidoreductase
VTTQDLPATHRVLRSTVRDDGTVEVSLRSEPVPQPGADQVLVRVEAAPINPSDFYLMFAGADFTRAERVDAGHPAVRAPLPAGALASVATRVGKDLPVGNEGAGVVVAAGSSEAARALLGRTVAVFGGAMYAQYRAVGADQVLALHEGTTPEQGASCFVNPLTALGMVETMRLEGHRALVHTAAASNLGQMLVRICQADGIGLVNIVRRDDQVRLLADLGAEHVVSSGEAGFADDLAAAVAATGATIAFDATGGGDLADQILTAMERAVTAASTEYARYGSDIHKQVYIYGGLDRRPTTLRRTYGFAWGVGGWLLVPFLARLGPEGTRRLRQRVADEVTTTFASSYAKQISLDQVVDPAEIAVYGRLATGQKYLVTPARG